MEAEADVEVAQTADNSDNFLKALVVDDILYIVRSIARILSAEGIFVLTATSGKEAIEKFVQYGPDLVTVDQRLPDMSGLSLVERIREIEGNPKAKIVFISSVYDKEEIRSILQHNIDGYLIKPFQKSRLVETVRGLVESSGNEE